MDFVYFLIGIIAIIIGLSCIGSFALIIYFIYKGMNLNKEVGLNKDINLKRGKDKDDKFQKYFE